MKILMVHNLYQERGGEDTMVNAEVRLLEAKGHQVVRYQRNNDELKTRGPFGSISAGFETVWAAKSVREISAIVAAEKPDVAHFHNTFPLISPACYSACRKHGVPVVQTLHNYRLLCPAATLFREGHVCEECLGRRVAWPGVAHRCYRRSRPATAAVAAMLATHHLFGTWRKQVDVYVALSEFARQRFIAGGLPAGRIMVRPNFIEPDPGPKTEGGDYALFVGRLSEEKGLGVLLEAWSRLRGEVPLRIAGDGPLMKDLANRIAANKLSDVTLMGRLSSGEVVRALHRARLLVFPSVWFEGFPVVVAQAFACAIPVIASRLGSLTEIVADGITGLHFSAGDPADLAAKVIWAWSHPREMEAMGRNARAEYELKYTGDRNYEKFLELWGRLGIHLDSFAEPVPESRLISQGKDAGK